MTLTKSREKTLHLATQSKPAAPSRAFEPNQANHGAGLFARANRSAPRAVGGPPAAVTRQAPGYYSLGGRVGGEGDLVERCSHVVGDAGGTHGEPSTEGRHPGEGGAGSRFRLSCQQPGQGAVAFVTPPTPPPQ